MKLSDTTMIIHEIEIQSNNGSSNHRLQMYQYQAGHQSVKSGHSEAAFFSVTHIHMQGGPGKKLIKLADF